MSQKTRGGRRTAAPTYLSTIIQPCQLPKSSPSVRNSCSVKPSTQIRVSLRKHLRGLGVDLYRTQTVGDNVGRIADIIREAQRRADIVITTGGLGPTVDDPTRQAIAEACGDGHSNSIRNSGSRS